MTDTVAMPDHARASGAAQATPSDQAPELHSLPRRLFEYGKIVFSRPFSAGGTGFAWFAAYMNRGVSPLNLGSMALFTVGGFVDGMQQNLDRIQEYHRQHHPRLHEDPKNPMSEAERKKPRGFLEKTLSIPAVGQIALFTAVATATAALAVVGAPAQMIVGTGLFMVGHGGFAGAGLLSNLKARRRANLEKLRQQLEKAEGPNRARLERRLNRAMKLEPEAKASQAPAADQGAAATGQDAAVDGATLPKKGLARLIEYATDHVKYRIGQAKIILGDPFNVGSVGFGSAAAVLNFGLNPIGLAAGITIATGAILQGIGNKGPELARHRALHHPTLGAGPRMRHGLKPLTPVEGLKQKPDLADMEALHEKLRKPAGLVERVVAFASKGGLGFALQAAGTALAATVAPVPVAIGLAGFATALGVFAVGSTIHGWRGHVAEREKMAEECEQAIKAAKGQDAKPSGPEGKPGVGHDPSIDGETPERRPTPTTALEVAGTGDEPDQEAADPDVDDDLSDYRSFADEVMPIDPQGGEGGRDRGGRGANVEEDAAAKTAQEDQAVPQRRKEPRGRTRLAV